MQVLRQSTAVDVLIGPFLDLTDAATAETGESPTVKVSKNGQALAAKNDITTPVHDADGYYNCELDATDTNTVGTLVLTVAASANALPIRHEYMVVEESVYDNFYASSAVGPATVAAISDGVWDEAQADHVAAGSFGVIATEIADILTDTADMQPKLGTPAGASISADIATIDTNVDAILVDTAEIGAAGAGLTAVPWNAAWDAEVQSEVDDALVARGLHYVVNTALPTNWTTDVTANSALDQMADDGTASFDRTTDSLQALADNAAPTAAAISDAVWDEAQADHVAAGSFGLIATEIADILTDTADMQPKLGTPAGASISADIATVDANVDAILVDTADMQPKLGTPAGASISADIATVDANVDAVLADTGTDGVVISTATAQAIADEILKRDFNSVSGEAARSMLNALRFLRNKWSISGTTLTVTKEDDATAAWTATVTTDATADPVTGNDPA